jgi:uncharacterized protein
MTSSSKPGRMSSAGARSRGPRPRRLPQRSCVSCGTTTAKRELVRIVRTPEGRVTADATGKSPGRGAYLCRQEACWEQGIKKGKLGRSLKTTVSKEDAEALLAFAEEMGYTG